MARKAWLGEKSKWCSFKMGKREGKSYIDHHADEEVRGLVEHDGDRERVDGESGETSPDRPIHTDSDLASPEDKDTPENPDMQLHDYSSTAVELPSEHPSINTSTLPSADIPSTAATHPDFAHLSVEPAGLGPASKSCSARVAMLFEERVAAPAKKSSLVRRLSVRRLKSRPSITTKSGAMKHNPSEGGIRGKSRGPALGTQVLKPPSLPWVPDPNLPAHVNGHCINSARRVAFGIPPSPIATPPDVFPRPRPDGPVFDNALQQPNKHFPTHLPSDDPISWASSLTARHVPNGHITPEHLALLSRIDRSATQVQEQGVLSSLNTPSIPSGSSTLVSSPGGSFSSPSSSSSRPRPNASVYPDLQAILAHTDGTASNIPQDGTFSPSNTPSIPTLSRSPTQPTVKSATSSLRRTTYDQAMWNYCETRLNSVAAEAAVQARAVLRKERGQSPICEEAVEEQATAVTGRKGRSKVVAIQTLENKIPQKCNWDHGNVEAGPSSTEMREIKRAGNRLHWEAAWHKPPTTSQHIVVPNQSEHSFSTLATMDYSISDAVPFLSKDNPTIATPPQPKPKPRGVVIPSFTSNAPRRTNSHEQVRSSATAASPVDSEATDYNLPSSLFTNIRRRGAISHHHTSTVHRPKSPLRASALRGQESYTEQPLQPRSSKRVSFPPVETIPRAPLPPNMNSNAPHAAAEESGGEDTDEESVEDWHSCHSKVSDEENDDDDDVKTPLLGQGGESDVFGIRHKHLLGPVPIKGVILV
ncbi:hypothetical protein K458DRAFT_385487 [Lentithecium fluviatile CBS 122367]|uniref:Uncharacterized protein n=1 Tax=Lentithecium fluviatile CBS 122367 TaxID=1168545 RepID=A0A6G1JCH1_9PLEO|nr:hypothetical protein K458DRAFT_385487 [Lentithecium fluviatile CBS 122367]